MPSILGAYQGVFRRHCKRLESGLEGLLDGFNIIPDLFFASRFQLDLVAKIQLFLVDVDADIDFFS